MKKNIIRFLPFTIFILLFCFLKFSKYGAANDLYFDIKTGESILKYGVDFRDHFSFIPNLIYLYHHWLYDLGIYFSYKLAGYGGLLFLYVLCYQLIGLTVFYVNYKKSKKIFKSFLVALLTLILINPFIQTRVQTFTFLLFYLYVYFLEKIYIIGEKKYLILNLLISLIIANIHMPIWILTIVFSLPYIFELCLSKKKNKLSCLNIKISVASNSKILIIFCILNVFIGLMTPFKLSIYTFFIKVINNGYYQFIGEMKYTNIFNSYSLLVLVVIDLILNSILKQKLNVRKVLFNFGIIVLSLMANRNTAFAYLFLPTIIFDILSLNIFPNYKVCFSTILTKKIYIKTNVIRVCFSIIFSFFLLSAIYNIDYKNFDFYEKDIYPYKTVLYINKFIDKNSLRIYNDFNYGSYLEFYDIPVFIDSRAEVFMKRFNGNDDIISDYENMREYSKMEEVLKKYDFNYALVYENSEINYFLKNSENYKEIFYEKNESASYVLYERTKPLK